MDGANAGTGQHGVGGLNHHRHVNTDAITFFNAALFEYVGQFAHLVVQHLIGDFFVVIRIIALPNDCRLIGFFGKMTIDTVDAHIQLTAVEPSGRTIVKIKRLDAGKWLAPGQKLIGLLSPELIGIFHRLLIHGIVFFAINPSAAGDRLRNRISMNF